ncbi:MAG: (Fe-S)-binding protein, partial [Cohaesibacteraceae bacterium]|nr:(Fe-S)-binding protein [Cohaesibacteraceae bacterium]
MTITSPAFKQNSKDALNNKTLQKALLNVESGFINKRKKSIVNLPEFDALRDEGKAIKDHTLAHLDLYLEEYEKNVI